MFSFGFIVHSVHLILFFCSSVRMCARDREKESYSDNLIFNFQNLVLFSCSYIYNIFLLLFLEVFAVGDVLLSNNFEMLKIALVPHNQFKFISILCSHLPPLSLTPRALSFEACVFFSIAWFLSLSKRMKPASKGNPIQ